MNGYMNGTILAILNLHAAPMPSTKFLLHPTYGLNGHHGYNSDGNVENVKSC